MVRKMKSSAQKCNERSQLETKSLSILCSACTLHMAHADAHCTLHIAHCTWHMAHGTWHMAHAEEFADILLGAFNLFLSR